MLQRAFKLKGLQLLWFAQATAQHSTKKAEDKLGLEYNNEHVKTKLLVDARTGRAEHSLAAKVYDNYLLGYNLAYDVASGNLEKYDAGLSWTPAPKVSVGVKHESVDKLNVTLGRALFYLHHVASSVNTVGTEFSINFADRIVNARAGITH